jgi:hypothetical protein
MCLKAAELLSSSRSLKQVLADDVQPDELITREYVMDILYGTVDLCSH